MLAAGNVHWGCSPLPVKTLIMVRKKYDVNTSHEDDGLGTCYDRHYHSDFYNCNIDDMSLFVLLNPPFLNQMLPDYLLIYSFR